MSRLPLEVYTAVVMDPGDERGGAERLLPELSTRFTSLPSEHIDEEIELGLRRLVEFLGTDRSTLLRFSPDRTSLGPVASWARPGLEPGTTIDVRTELPWYHAQLVQGETVRFRPPDDLPDEAVEEKAYARRLGLQSNLTTPIRVGGQLVCALATDAFRMPREWPDPVVERVRLVGQVFANALHRQRIETELRATVTAIERRQDEREASPGRDPRPQGPAGGGGSLPPHRDPTRERVRRDRRPEPGPAEVLAKVAQVAPTTSAVLILGESGHRQGARGPRHPRPQPSPARAPRHGQLRGPAGDPHRERAVRPREGRVHRGDRGEGGPLRAGRRGHALPGRDRRAAPDLQAKLLRVLQDGEFERVGPAAAARWTCGSWPPPTATSGGPCPTAASARTSTSA